MTGKKTLTPKTIAVVLTGFLCVIAVILFVYSESKAKSASSEIEYYFVTKISDQEKHTIEPSKDGSYALKANIAYKISLTADGTVNNGYCKILSDVSDKVLTTQQIAKQSTISFTLIPEKDASYTFIPVSGTNVLSADVKDRGTIGTLQKQEVKVAEQETADTTAAGDDDETDWYVEESYWDYAESDDSGYSDSGNWTSSSSSSSAASSSSGSSSVSSSTAADTPAQSPSEPSSGADETVSEPDNPPSDDSNSQESESSSDSAGVSGQETGELTQIQ